MCIDPRYFKRNKKLKKKCKNIMSKNDLYKTVVGVELHPLFKT